ncbi:HNH endonuclease signature motif containing protein [Vagococcus luciliae]|uniref:Putative HNH nuclease YajD n=1 Tax=Vagococcus luciliae TaxID=2920380 RepID=A0ABY5NWT5_9ENTE|nr:HNH endonuclease signature motif containing protein [Vagococcus luciliae]UUV97987.1 hypothetical protein G314FT_00780 [Vagococcus luciliae]
MKPKKQCNHASCTKLVDYDIRYCEKHEKVHSTNQYKDRMLKDEKYIKFYQSRQWRKASLLYRYKNPICEKCERSGKIVKADVVDHIIEIKDDFSKRLDESNFQSLCHACHNTKTNEVRLYRANNPSNHGG